ncbi:glycosyltransferase family 4 protein [Nitrospira sp. Kam-Ns4a]
MRIGIDANPIVGDRGGIGWHTYHLIRALLNLKEDLDLLCYVKPGAVRRGKVTSWESGVRAAWVESGRAMLRWRGVLDHLDLFHGTNFKMPTTGRYGGVVTIHDLWLDRHPEYSAKLFGQKPSFYRTRRTAWRARKVVTVSEFSARDIQALYDLPAERVTVIYNGVAEAFRPTPDAEALEAFRRKHAVPTGRFILFVGGADPRKNHQILLRAYARVAELLTSHTLVMVGDPIHRFGDIRQTARTFGVESRVVCPGRLSAGELRLLYSHADLFVFPSLYEGFGMPVLEAMACGAPVITANTTALPEVAGEAALLVDPRDAEGLANAMIRVIEDERLREELRVKGFERAKQFTWESAARRTVALYRDLCGEKS